jgi:hypothetical protein
VLKNEGISGKKGRTPSMLLLLGQMGETPDFTAIFCLIADLAE